jgi:hypothetical protein
MTGSFQPQPYPLFAVTSEKVENPSRFQLTDPDDPVHLVLGWHSDVEGKATPILAYGKPGGTAWTGPIFYAETRERAEEIAKQVAKTDRHDVRYAQMARAVESRTQPGS